MTDNATFPDNAGYAAFARTSSFIRLLAIVAFLLIGLKVASYGYLPPSDARRHAADAMTGKPYKDVVVMRPEYQINHSPGWDSLLRWLHTSFGMSEDGLVAFSIVGLWFVVLLAPLPWLRCADAWIGAVLLFGLAEPSFISRLLQARPFVLTEAILIAVLAAWTRPGKPSWFKIVLTSLGFALSTWMHGAWYLWAVVPLAFALARQWRAAVTLGFCWLAGAFIGAAFTGQPLAFLKQSVVLALIIAHEKVPVKYLVGEFQPSPGEFPMLLIICAVFLWSHARVQALMRSPLFWLSAICWLLGLKVMRYWLDWGCPAALLWVTLELEGFIVKWWSDTHARRLAVTCLISAALYLSATADMKGRYTDCLNESYIDGSLPELKGWMPDSGGIFYTAEMEFFYSTFYHNPTGDWRYSLGFEPAWMPPEDLKIFRAIQLNNYAWTAYQPWVGKMRPEDRMEILGGGRPELPPLEWTRAGEFWIGRLPKKHPAK